MSKYSILIIPDHRGGEVSQFKVARAWVLCAQVGLFMGAICFGYFLLDYISLKDLKPKYEKISLENKHLKGEAQVLMSNLDQVNRTLDKVQGYTDKLNEMVSFRVKKVSKKTGIGPLTEEEFNSARKQKPHLEKASETRLPLGINLDRLSFKPLLEKLAQVETNANRQAYDLQKLLSTLSQKSSMLASIPTIKPVDGWITSNFGSRLSPFTNKKTRHRGMDIAAQVGTAIFAPADGVVIFSGKKSGFGKFIMIAHGYGVVTRYGHNAENMVQLGQKVSRGDQIATVGMTGRTTGPHLHYEIWVNGDAVDPRKFTLNPADAASDLSFLR